MDMSDYDESEDTNAAGDKEKLVERAQRFLKRASEAEAKQREREREDLRFQVPDLQWDEAARRQRLGDAMSPARPTLSISKLDQPMQLVSNQMRSADLGITIQPISEDADDETAEILQGLYRHIERTSRAELARSWAFDRARAAGRGVYRILTEYDEEGGELGDQKIVIKRILHQDAVYFDPTAQEPDFSDGKELLVTSWVSREDFQRMYPKAKGATADRSEWQVLAEEAPEWVTDEDLLVAEYWYKEFETTEDGRERVKAIHCCKVSGWEVIERQEWSGKYIPFVPVIGRELIPFDEQRRWVGMIGPAKDGQKLYNYAASTLVERMALEPKAPFIGYKGQFEGVEEEWRQANTRNFPYLEVNPTMIGDQPAPLPQRSQIDQSGMSLAMMALQEADQFIQATTAVFDPSLGRLPQKERSGRAIQALQQQADAGTSHYLQNLADISLTYEAKIILDLIPAIYDRPGRITRILRGDDGKSETVILNRPFTVDPRTKRPVPVSGGQPGPQPARVKEYDLRKGVYSVSVSVGKSFQTRLEEGATEIGEILTAKPDLMPILGDIYFRFREFPGAKEIADRLAKIREQQYPGLGEGEDGQMPPEQAQAKIQTLEQQLQLMQAQFQAALKALETDQAKQQAMLQKAEMDNTSRERIAEMNNETKLMLEGLVGRLARIEAGLTHAHEARQQHEQMAHETALAAAGGQTLNMTLDRAEEQGQEQGQDMSTDGGGMEQ